MQTLLTILAAIMLLGATVGACTGGEGEVEEQAAERQRSAPSLPYGIHGRASVDEMAVSSPIIVRATLDSVRAVGLPTIHQNDYVPALEYTIRVVEYLKGSGGTTLKAVALWTGSDRATEAEAESVISVLLQERDKRWDDREAIVFLRPHPGGDGYLRNGDNLLWLGPAGFAESSTTFTMASAEAPAWLPDAQASGGGARSVEEQRFLLEDPGSTGASTRSTGGAATQSSITLTSLKSKIGDMKSAADASSDPAAYWKCMASEHETRRLNGLGESRQVTFATALGSGQPAGTEVWTYEWAEVALAEHGPTRPPDDSTGEGKTWWFEGRDAEILDLYIDHPGIAYTGAPLPAGEYRAFMRTRGPEEVICDGPSLMMESWEHVITVTAPEGTLAEAFYDPVADGAATSATTTIGTIRYESNTVKATLTPTVTNQHILDFIALDGSVTLSLGVSDATEADGVLSWAVTPAPWSAGDQLMLRIRQPVASVTVTLSPREEQVSTVTFTYTDILIEWFDPDQCDSRYLVGLYRGETVIRFLGFHPAPETTSFSEDTHMAWDTISNYDWRARVTCAPSGGSEEWRVLGEAPIVSGLPGASGGE